MFKYRKLVKLGKATFKDLRENEEKFTMSQSKGADAEANRYYFRTVRLSNYIYELFSVAWIVFGVDGSTYARKIGMGGD